MTKTWALSWVLLVGAVPAAAQDAQSITVTSRTRTGVMTEEMTHVGSGQWAGRVAFLDGYDVWMTGAGAGAGRGRALGLCKPMPGQGLAVGHEKCPQKTPAVAFTLDAATLGWAPRGMAFLEDAGEFVFNGYDRTTGTFPLVFTDEAGVYRRTVPVRYPAGFGVFHVEALDAIPSESAEFADRLAMAVYSTDANSTSSIVILTRDGAVEQLIPLTAPEFAGGIAGLSWAGGGRFRVGLAGRPEVYTVDTSGQVVAGPLHVEGARIIEAVEQLPDGRMMAAEYGYGRAWTFDAQDQHLPGEDVSFGPALGLSRPLSLAVDPGTGDLLVLAYWNEVYRVSPALDRKERVLDLNLTPAILNGFAVPGMDVLPETGQLVLAHQLFSTPETGDWPRAVSFVASPWSPETFRPGFPVRQEVGAILNVTYVPSTERLLVKLRATGAPINRTRLPVYAVDGTKQPVALDVSAHVSNVAALGYVYPPTPLSGPGHLLVFGDGVLHLLTLDGTTRVARYAVPADFNVFELLQDPADATGKSFLGLESDKAEVVRFRLP